MIKLGLIAIASAMAFGGGSITTFEDNVPTTDIVDSGTSEPTSETETPDTPETPEVPEVPETPEVFESTIASAVYYINDENENVSDTANKYGDILISAEQGHVGDEVTVYVAGNPTVDFSGKVISLYKYAISYVTHNGIKITPTNAEKGEYTITLVEGENKIEAYFKNKTELSVMDISAIDWKSLLTVDNLLKLIYFILTLFLSSGFFLTLIKSKKYKVQSVQEATEAAKNATNDTVNTFLTETVKPLLEKQSEQTKDSNDTARVLMRVTLLAQENTPESRAQIVKELQNYRTTDQELAEQVKAIVDSAIKQNEEKKQAQSDAIKAVKDSVESVGETTDKEDSGNDYGTI